VDEHQLAELFREAVRGAPPPSFDERDVASASHRARARQRTAIVAGSTLGVALLVGGAVVGADLVRGGGGTHDAAAPMAPQQRTVAPHAPMNTLDLPVPGAPSPGGPPPWSFPEVPPEQGGGTSGDAGPRAGGAQSGCGPADRELAVALAGELPAAADSQPVPVAAQCPPGARAAGYVVRDNSDVGLFSVVLVPGGAGGTQTRFSGPGGVTVFSVTTRGGAELVVASQPQQGSANAPFGDQVSQVAQHLAERY